MSLGDIFFAPIYVALLLILAPVYVKKYLRGTGFVRFFYWGLFSRILATIAFGFIYFFYYGGGDTFNYFHDSLIVTEILQDKPVEGIGILFTDYAHDNEYYNDPRIYHAYFYYDHASFFIVKIAAFVNFFTFSTYMATSILFTLLGFIGSWQFFYAFNKIFPEHTKFNGYVCVLAPSIIFWGSGLMKDTVTFFALGILFKGMVELDAGKKTNLFTWTKIILGLWLLKSIKIYILMCFFPCAILLFATLQSKYIKNQKLRMLVKPIILSFAIFFITIAVNYISAGDTKYSLDNITKTAEITNQWIRSMGGSSYDIGSLEFSPSNLPRLILAGINVTLFRPYLWEIRNPLMLMSALETTFFLVFTIVAFRRSGVMRGLKLINQNPYLLMGFIFSLTFAFAIGISTGNFGTLVRYKIPIIPFYLIMLYQLYIYKKPPKKKMSKMPD